MSASFSVSTSAVSDSDFMWVIYKVEFKIQICKLKITKLKSAKWP